MKLRSHLAAWVAVVASPFTLTACFSNPVTFPPPSSTPTTPPVSGDCRTEAGEMYVTLRGGEIHPVRVTSVDVRLTWSSAGRDRTVTEPVNEDVSKLYPPVYLSYPVVAVGGSFPDRCDVMNYVLGGASPSPSPSPSPTLGWH